MWYFGTEKMGKAHTPQQECDEFDPREAQRRFEAALRGARIVGHKPQSAMKIGKPRGKHKKNTKKKPR
jgi:hypothetical protein